MTPELAALIDSFEIISEKNILHRVGTRGVVIAKVQRCRLGDSVADVRTWVQWETGAVHHIDSIPVA
jgi:hypothetical protein